jgi:hypothetical protein
VKATKSFIVLFPPTQTTRIKAGYIKLISTPVFLQYNYILHDSLNTMIGKTSVSMMVLLVVAASLIGISSIHQYVEGQGPRVTKLPQQLSAVGTVDSVRLIASPPGTACAAALRITQTISPTTGGLPAGTGIVLVAPNEHWCTLFALSKIVSK